MMLLVTAALFCGALWWLCEASDRHRHGQQLVALCILIIATFGIIVEVTHAG